MFTEKKCEAKPAILKLATVKLLLDFASDVTEQGLIGELPPPEKASDSALATYKDAAALDELIRRMKKEDPEEWERLRQCNLPEWSDTHPFPEGKSFEAWFDKVFKQFSCVSAFKGTVARFIYEQVANCDVLKLDDKKKRALLSLYINDYFDLTWKVKLMPMVVMRNDKASLIDVKVNDISR